MKSQLKAALCAAAATVALAAGPEVPYPDGYRDWNHVKSMVIEEGTRSSRPSAAFTISMQTSWHSKATAPGGSRMAP